MTGTQLDQKNTLKRLQNLAASGTVADAREIVEIGNEYPKQALEALEKMGCPGFMPSLIAQVALADMGRNGFNSTSAQALRMLIRCYPNAAENIKPEVTDAEMKLARAIVDAPPNPGFHLS